MAWGIQLGGRLWRGQNEMLVLRMGRCRVGSIVCPSQGHPPAQPWLEPSRGNQGSETGAVAVEPV